MLQRARKDDRSSERPTSKGLRPSNQVAAVQQQLHMAPPHLPAEARGGHLPGPSTQRSGARRSEASGGSKTNEDSGESNGGKIFRKEEARSRGRAPEYGTKMADADDSRKSSRDPRGNGDVDENDYDAVRSSRENMRSQLRKVVDSDDARQGGMRQSSHPFGGVADSDSEDEDEESIHQKAVMSVFSHEWEDQPKQEKKGGGRIQRGAGSRGAFRRAIRNQSNGGGDVLGDVPDAEVLSVGQRSGASSQIAE